MRIGVIVPPWIPVPPPAYGGIEEVVDVLARGLTDLGHQVVLAAHPGSTCPVEYIPAAADGVSGPIGDAAQELRHVVHAYAALERLGVDLVHDNTVAGPAYRNRPAGLPVVTTVHGQFTPELQQTLRSVHSEVAVVAISHDQASRAGPVQVAAVIHHGIDVDRVRPGDGTGGYLAFLGRMAPAKGVREAIQIARRVGIPLRIAAKMRERAEHDYFTDEVEPLLGSDAEYLGELAREEKFDLLRGALALVNPLRWHEPFGMVMIEAMTAGTPVIAVPQGSATEIVEDGLTGFLRESLEDLADAVTEAGTLDRGRIRQRVIERFSRRRVAADYAALFATVLREHDQPVPDVAGKTAAPPESAVTDDTAVDDDTAADESTAAGR